MNPFDYITKLMAELGDLAPATMATLILIGINLLLRSTPDIKNAWIPWISVISGMILFPIYLPLATKFDNPLGRNIGLGFLVGLAAAVGYGSIVRLAETKWPWLHDVLNSDRKQQKKEQDKDDETDKSI